jgi:mannose-6-phosphate isomerase-like protein (cupin superfamily)
MVFAGRAGPDGEFAARPLKPVNLTASAEALPWAEACKTICVSGSSEKTTLDVCGLTFEDSGQHNDGMRETVYVVTAGFGALRWDEEDIECTAGDLLFVPRGCPHHFERSDARIQIWRISMI